MNLYSTTNANHTTNFTKAVLQGLADDGGLYMLEHITTLPQEFFDTITSKSFADMSVEIMQTLIGEMFGGEEWRPDLEKIVRDTINFDAPLVQLNDTTFVVELFHGPTLAFKDFGARFMARMMRYLRERYVQDTRQLTVLVATSGDTGSAVARGFWNIPGIRVVILYPEGKVSFVQEQQLTTMGANVQALEVRGTFDDCQVMVKTAFQDIELNKQVALTSANSINIARLLPQALYYFWGYAQLLTLFPELRQHPPLFCTPSGNFGNLTAGLFAQRMGLPVQRFIAGVNQNDTMPRYLTTGIYQPKPSVSTPSNAMDVGNPSNFARMATLYGNNVEDFQKEIWSVSISDKTTLQTIKDVYQRFNYVMCPHTAVAFAALEEYRTTEPQSAQERAIILSTAHPAKFGDVVEPILQTTIQIPERLQEYLEKTKHAIQIPADYSHLKEYLIRTSESL